MTAIESHLDPLEQADGASRSVRDEPERSGTSGKSGTNALRPRERLFSEGVNSLRASELVSIVLGTGLPGRPAEVLARDLLDRAGGLRGMATSTVAELTQCPGLGAARAARLMAALELGCRARAEPLRRGASMRSSADVFRHFHEQLRDLLVEQFHVVLLDGKHRVIRTQMVSQGTLTTSPVHPREVFAPAIRHSAAAVVLVHNHPSGDPAPSADDLAITRRLTEVGELVGIRVLDHIVVGDGRYASLADRGLLGS